MYHQFYILPTQCIYTSGISQQKHREFHALQHSISLNNRHRKCLLRGTNWVFNLD